MSTFKIEKDVPIPAPLKPGPRTANVFTVMKVGDSFLHVGKNLHSVRANMAATAKRANAKSITRQTAEGIRVWRTA